MNELKNKRHKTNLMRSLHTSTLVVFNPWPGWAGDKRLYDGGNMVLTCGTRVNAQLDVVIGCLWKGKASEAPLGGFIEFRENQRPFNLSCSGC